MSDHIADDIPPEVRRRVLERDEYRCRSCGEQDTSKLTLHHVQFRSQGGAHTEDNLVTVCWNRCHRLIHEGKLNVANVDGKWFFGRTSYWRRRLK